MNTHLTWSDFLGEINQACLAVGCRRPGDPVNAGREPWFRGQNRSSHGLLPSLFRKPYADPDGADKPHIQWVESELFYEFAARARELHESTMTDWDILFAMQHYGVPTRLLDWTEVLGVAVYFSTWGAAAEDDPPSVWVMNPYRLNQRFHHCDDLLEPRFLVSDGPDGTKLDYGQTICQWNGVHWEEPISLYPRQKTDRMHMQCGWFTVHGNRHVAIDELPGSSDFCTQVRLPAAALPAARTFLEQAGINRRTLFPDMQNLAVHLREQFGLLHGAEPRRRPESIASPESSQIQSSAARCI